MNTKKLCLICIALVAMVTSCTNTKTCFDDDSALVFDNAIEDNHSVVIASSDTGIAISLTRNNGHVLEPVPQHSIFVAIWHDGHILLMEQHDGSAESLETHNFQWGIVEKDYFKELQNRLISLFRIRGERIQILDVGPSASSIVLKINADKTSVSINTWQQYESAKHFPDRLILRAENTIDNSNMYLEEFYERWKVAIGDIFAFKEGVDRNKLLAVDVSVDQRIVRVYDKKGILLFERNLFHE